MGLLSSSKKNTTNNEYNTDNSSTVVSTTLSGDGNVSGNGNTIVTNEINEDVLAIGAGVIENISADQSNVAINQTETALAMANGGFDLAADISAQGTTQLNIASDVVNNANNNMTDLSIETSALVVDAASGFVSDATDLAIETMAINNDALGIAGGVASNALSFAENTTGASLAHSENLTGQSFAFGEELAKNAMNSVLSSNDNVTAVSMAANGQMFDLSNVALDNQTDLAIEMAAHVGNVSATAIDSANNAMMLNADVSNNAMFANADLVKTAFATNSDATGQAFELAETLTIQTNEQMNQNTDSTLRQLNAGFETMGQFMQNATRSDGALVAESTNKMAGNVVIAIGGLAGLGLLVLLFKGKN